MHLAPFLCCNSIHKDTQKFHWQPSSSLFIHKKRAVTGLYFNSVNHAQVNSSCDDWILTPMNADYWNNVSMGVNGQCYRNGRYMDVCGICCWWCLPWNLLRQVLKIPGWWAAKWLVPGQTWLREPNLPPHLSSSAASSAHWEVILSPETSAWL